jgi:hypothetical protein
MHNVLLRKEIGVLYAATVVAPRLMGRGGFLGVLVARLRSIGMGGITQSSPEKT